MMRKWFIVNGARNASPQELTALCDEWYTITRDGWNGWTTFYQPNISAVSTGEKGGDNKGLTCTPSTDAVANQDDYAGLPLFAVVDCNWEVDQQTLEPIITAIDGVTDNFVRSDPSVYVGVLQMAGYHYSAETNETYTHGYSAVRNVPYANVEPVAESVRADGSVRPWVVHAKYMSHTTGGKMTSCAGLIPTGWLSHNTLHALSANNGPQYSGTTTADDTWMKLMCYIKYASLTLDGILQGCAANNHQYNAAVGENDVRRVLLTATQAANLSVGMSVLIGTYAGNTDRGQASMYNITGQAGALITAIEDVQVEEASYKVVYVDTEDAFETVANGANQTGTTYISTFHWPTGKTDSVLGNDGSPVSNTSGKYPAKLQGIEYMVGGYEVVADVILNVFADGDGEYWYEPNIVREGENQSTAITGNYEATGLKCAQPAADAWQYIVKFGYAKGVFFPILASRGGSTAYTRDAFYENANVVKRTREWLAFGALSTGVGCAGLSCLNGTNALSGATWHFLARLSPNGNRGEWAS